ncbi:MAG: hypothetical protein ACKOFW_12030, partial [Planctomycetaceae bacterium]
MLEPRPTDCAGPTPDAESRRAVLRRLAGLGLTWPGWFASGWAGLGPAVLGPAVLGPAVLGPAVLAGEGVAEGQEREGGEVAPRGVADQPAASG